jgi:hypothetical protein
VTDFPPTQELDAVEFIRHPGDFGVSVVVRADCAGGRSERKTSSLYTG